MRLQIEINKILNAIVNINKCTFEKKITGEYFLNGKSDQSYVTPWGRRKLRRGMKGMLEQGHIWQVRS